MVGKKPKAAKKVAGKRATAAALKPRTPKLTTKATPKTSSEPSDASPNEDADWRAKCLSRVRILIGQAVPEVVEERKWRKPLNAMAGVPVWSSHGIICTGETYKDKVKLTFARGASLADRTGLFNAGLEGNARRAIDIQESEKIDEKAFKALVRAAVAFNASLKKK